MLIISIPVPLPTLTNPERHIPGRYCSGHYTINQLTDDLLVNQPEVVQINQRAEVTFIQILLNTKIKRTLIRQRLKGCFILATVFPPPQKDQ